MSTKDSQPDRATDSRRTVTHSKERALDEREFERFLDGARQLDNYRAEQARFIAFVGGRLGLRPGEIAHISEDWVDWRRKMIVIPRHDPCTKGINGDACGYCRGQTRQYVEINNYSLADARSELIQQGELLGHIDPLIHGELRSIHEKRLHGDLAEEEYEEIFDECVASAAADHVFEQFDRKARSLMADHDLTFDEAIDRAWSAKTDAAAREVPFGFDVRTEMAIECFFDRYDEYPHSKTTVNRRVDLAADAASGFSREDVTPHGLRSSAASLHAGRGLDVLALQSMFGWVDIQTAKRYVNTSGANTARALHEVHSR